MTEHPLMIETNPLPVHDTQSPPMTHTYSPIAYTRSVPAAEKQLAKQPPSSANASSKKFKVKVRLPKSGPLASKTTNATTAPLTSPIVPSTQTTVPSTSQQLRSSWRRRTYCSQRRPLLWQMNELAMLKSFFTFLYCFF